MNLSDDYAKETALIEAVLYLETEPKDTAALSRISGLSEEMIHCVLENLNDRYAEQYSGIKLANINGAYMLIPKQEYWDELKDRYNKKNEGKISQAAMETLSIIAYSQPVTRAEIESIRGVASADSMIRLLVEKDLIREVGKKDIPGKPVQFGTTKEFLRQFNLNSIAELPRLSDSEADRFELEGEPM
jgi:segregation and condensation protein B